MRTISSVPYFAFATSFSSRIVLRHLAQDAGCRDARYIAKALGRHHLLCNTIPFLLRILP